VPKKPRFAINLPFTKRIVISGTSGSKTRFVVSSLLIIRAAIIAGGVNELDIASTGPKAPGAPGDIR
jgi:hypothetical protein